MTVLFNGVDYELESITEFPTDKENIVRIEFEGRRNGKLLKYSFDEVLYKDGDYYESGEHYVDNDRQTERPDN